MRRGTRAVRTHSVSHMPMTYRAVRRALSRAGWVKVRQQGAHQIWEAAGGGRRTVIAGRDGDMVPAGTLAAIRRQTGMGELR